MSLLALSTEDVSSETQFRALPPSMVERMTLIMDAFSSPTTRLTLEQVAQITHLPRSTAHRILEQLVGLSWLEHACAGYFLGTRSLGLGGSGRGDLHLREAAAGVLHELQMRTSLVAHLAILEGGDVHCLDKIGGRLARDVPSRVGGRTPAHRTALGKAILAWLPAEEVEAICLIGEFDTLHQELSRTRGRNGLTFERGECFSTVGSVACAVRGPEGPVAAISLAGQVEMPFERVAPLVVAAAREVSRDLFGPGFAAPRRTGAR